MQDYETHIINTEGALSLVAIDKHISDFCAIRAALRLCKQGYTAHVWRDNEYIYSDAPRGKSTLFWPVRKNAGA